MAAAKGNKNAEVWTEKTVLAELKKIDKFIKMPGRFYFVTAALAQLGHYDELWAYWQHKFADNKIVFKAIKNIEACFKTKLVEAALSEKVNASVAIFTLKNMGMTDRTDLNLSGSSKIVFEVIRSGNGKKG